MRNNRAVFFDRDGVLNEAVVREGRPYPPVNLTETRLVAGAREALMRLRQRGFLLFVVTNQPDVSRGTSSRSQVEEINQYLAEHLPIDEFCTCCHDDKDGCSCRKPLPGLLLTAAEKHAVQLDRSFMVGDRWRDIDAGTAAGCRTILIDYSYQERGPSKPPDQTVFSLTDAVDWILNQEE